MPSFPDHFSQLAARYAAYRPRYPAALLDALAARCPARAVAWDVGCGSGQLSVALASRFARVIATDPAAAQLAHAAPHPRIAYRCAPAEASGLDDASVDLAVAAQAAHWFDWPRFVAEVGRVVRPGGVVALVSYGHAAVSGAAGEALARYYAAIAPHWPPQRAHVDNGYRDLALPKGFAPLDAPLDGEPQASPGGAKGLAPLDAMTARWTRDELVGYATTWSATARYVAAHGEGALDELRAALAAAWPDNDAREVRWPLTIILARRT